MKTVEKDPAWEPGAELEEKVRRLSREWSKDRPDYQEDLYQEAMLAIWLRGECQSPLSHQYRTA